MRSDANCLASKLFQTYNKSIGDAEALKKHPGDSWAWGKLARMTPNNKVYIDNAVRLGDILCWENWRQKKQKYNYEWGIKIYAKQLRRNNYVSNRGRSDKNRSGASQ